MGKYAIFIVSALIFSLLTYSSALRNALFMSNTRTIESHGTNQAYNIAQSAMMVAVKDIRENGEDSSFHPATDTEYSYPSASGFQEWEDMEGSYNIFARNQGDTLLTIRATGRFSESRYIVGVGLKKSSDNLFDWPSIDQAVHADKSIDIKGSVQIHGDVSTNSTSSGTVNLTGSVQIDSTLFIGPGGNSDQIVNQRGSVDIADGIQNLPNELEYPMPEFPPYPAFLWTGDSVDLKGSSSLTLYPLDYVDYYIPEISLIGSSRLTIHLGESDQTLYVGNFIQSGSSRVYLSGSGNLELYVENSFTLNGSNNVNVGGEVNDLFMYYGGSDKLEIAGSAKFNGGIFVEKAEVDLKGSQSLLGNLIAGGSDVTMVGSAKSRVIYAPNADVELKGSVPIHGSVISKSFSANGSVDIYYDDMENELPDLEEEGGAPTITISYWN